MKEISRKHMGEWMPEDRSKVDETYDLIKVGSKAFAKARIHWDGKTNSLKYEVIEPKIDDRLKGILKQIESILIDRLEIKYDKFDIKKSEDFIGREMDVIASEYNFTLSEADKTALSYYLQRDFIGLERVEPLFQDIKLEDISCDGTNVPVFVFHRNPSYGSIQTNTIFSTQDEIDSFVMKLAQRCDRAISVAEPLLDGTLPDGSRVQATFGTDVSRRGSTFTIRKFTPEPLTPVDLLKFGTTDTRTLAYLWLLIEHGYSILVAGASATGKTALLNALSLFIQPDAKIVSIEDTAELRLPHENWIPQVARIGFGPRDETGDKLGEVSMFDLLKASMRQRPDYIIVGEVRGQETYVLFQEMASGHPGLSTMHADSIDAVMDRLVTEPISLPPSLIENLDVLIVIVREKIKGKYVRRIKRIVEVTGFDARNNKPIINEVFRWDHAKDSFLTVSESKLLKDIMNERGANRESLNEELHRRAQILEWFVKKKITNYRDVHKYIDMYYTDPAALLDTLG
ncbi:MAG: type II/IV secretion system ATPase subunit [archaeon]